MLEKTTILEVKINLMQIEELLEFISKTIQYNRVATLGYVNAHAMILASENARFKDFLNHADVVFCDGFGINLAAKVLGKPSPPRLTPPDWIGDLLALCTENKFRIFILGAEPGVSEKAVEKLKHGFLGIEVCGFEHGYFDKKQDSIENNRVVEKINNAQPDILIVGFGMPTQEYWIEENRSKLNVSVILPVGALIDHLGGTVKRAPKWMTNHGLEWLGRLIFEPKRLWRRYIIGLPKFVFLVLEEFFLRKSMNREG